MDGNHTCGSSVFPRAFSSLRAFSAARSRRRMKETIDFQEFATIRPILTRILLSLTLFCPATHSQAEAPARPCKTTPQLTREDYARAEKLLFWNVSSLYEAGIRHQHSQLIFNAVVVPHWIDGSDRFWYRKETREGARFILVDPGKASRQPAFDHTRLAAALSVSGKHYTADTLPFGSFTLAKDNRSIQFDAGKD